MYSLQKWQKTTKLTMHLRWLGKKVKGFHSLIAVGAVVFNWWVSFAPEFQCCYFCESSCLFYLSFNFDFYVSKIMHL